MARQAQRGHGPSERACPRPRGRGPSTQWSESGQHRGQLSASLDERLARQGPALEVGQVRGHEGTLGDRIGMVSSGARRRRSSRSSGRPSRIEREQRALDDEAVGGQAAEAVCSSGKASKRVAEVLGAQLEVVAVSPEERRVRPATRARRSAPRRRRAHAAVGGHGKARAGPAAPADRRPRRRSDSGSCWISSVARVGVAAIPHESAADQAVLRRARAAVVSALAPVFGRGADLPLALACGRLLAGARLARRLDRDRARPRSVCASGSRP